MTHGCLREVCEVAMSQRGGRAAGAGAAGIQMPKVPHRQQNSVFMSLYRYTASIAHCIHPRLEETDFLSP